MNFFQNYYFRIHLVVLNIAAIMLINVYFANFCYAESATDLLKNGIIQFKQANFKQAKVEIEKALEQNLNENDKIEAFKYLAFLAILFQEEQNAIQYFQDILLITPDFQLSIAESPRFRKVFEKVKNQETEPPKITAEFPHTINSQNDLMINAKITDVSGISSAIIYFKNFADTSFSQANMINAYEDRWEVVIPNVFIKPDSFCFYLEAVDNNGNLPGSFGTSTNPNKIFVIDAVEKKGFPWLWVGLGTIALGSGATYLLLDNGNSNSVTIDESLPVPPKPSN